ncbi:hypothetical protein OUZ56_026865 [Daphnia magna]|uniref:Uncharacterized protein n=1 Tax=Daphnia magna TaxID=35525 RepID=A0ABQ9ZN23_9CRUS|nr:hypothetical protein OUZ56_026865 [Daphnia magna]
MALPVRDIRPPQCVILMQSSRNEVDRFEPSQAKAEVLDASIGMVFTSSTSLLTKSSASNQFKRSRYPASSGNLPSSNASQQRIHQQSVNRKLIDYMSTRRFPYKMNLKIQGDLVSRMQRTMSCQTIS